jgi:hypothetical protein
LLLKEELQKSGSAMLNHSFLDFNMSDVPREALNITHPLFFDSLLVKEAPGKDASTTATAPSVPA